jgi:PAS domain S-box-containing protein
MRALWACVSALSSHRPSRGPAFALGVLLALAGQAIRIPLDPPTLFPFITFIPCILVSALLGGIGTGLLTTALCTAESLYFSVAPVGSLRITDLREWIGILSMVASGVIASILFEHLKRAEQSVREATSELAAIYDNTPVHLLVVDEHLRVRKWNERLGLVVNQTPSACIESGPEAESDCSFERDHPNGCAFGQDCAQGPLSNVIQESLREGVCHERVEVWLPTGTEAGHSRCFLVSTAPVGLSTKRVVVWAQDITELKETLEQLQESRTRLETALADAETDHSLLTAVFAAQPDGMFVCDNNGTVILTNPTTIAFFGFNPTGMRISELREKLEMPGGIEASLTQKALHGETTNNQEQAAGDRVLETSSAPIRDGSGSIIGAVTVIRDITVHRRIEEALKNTVSSLESALTEKTVLLQEVHHRVKNNLAVVGSLLGMRIDLTEPGDVRDALEESQQRIYSIALIHEQLYGGDLLNRINFAEYACQLLVAVSSMLGEKAERISIRTDLEPIELGVHRAVPCALILNELVLNTYKHAFPDDRQGEIRIGFHQPEPGFLELSVEDDGVGYAPSSDSTRRKSLGLRIVEILTKQLDGSLRQESGGGTRFVLRFAAGSSRKLSTESSCEINLSEWGA